MGLTSSEAWRCQDNARLTIRSQASNAVTQLLSLLFLIGSSDFSSVYFAVHVYTPFLLPLSLCQFPSGDGLCLALGQLRPDIVIRFSGHVLQGPVSLIVWEHGGFVESVETIMPYLSDIFRQKKISFPFHFLLCKSKWMRA